MDKKSFVSFMVDCGVLTFGDFTLKSGRKAPFFINTGNYRTGSQLSRLGEFYADCIVENGLKPDTLFGPAYKGIPLAVACASALWTRHSIDVGYCFDRKEAKDHGEGGVIVGKKLENGEKLLIIEDVVTAGTAIRQVIPTIKAAADADIIGMIISVDRMERGQGESSAVQEIRSELGFGVYPIVTVLDIIEALKNGDVAGKEYVERMLEYRALYGVE